MILFTPNRLTAFRVVLAFVCPFLLMYYRSVTMELVVTGIFTIACITDWWDGHLARSLGMVTTFGKIVDPIADKLLIGGLMLLFSVLGLYPVELVIPIVVREVIVTVARLSRLSKGLVLPAEWAGKFKVAFQIGSIYATFVYLIALDSALLTDSWAFLLNFLKYAHFLGIALAIFFTMASGITFFQRLDSSP